jgi:hypothetical protein
MSRRADCSVAANAYRDRLRARRRWLAWRAELDHRTVRPEDAPHQRLARAGARGLAPRDLLLISLRA